MGTELGFEYFDVGDCKWKWIRDGIFDDGETIKHWFVRCGIQVRTR
jgi:hypothetical protein